MSKDALEITAELIVKRVAELYWAHANIRIGEPVPEWVYPCLDRVTKEALGPDVPARTTPEFQFFVAGLFLGNLGKASNEKIDVLHDPDFTKAAQRAIPHVWFTSFRRLFLKMKILTVAQLGQQMQPKLAAELVAGTDADRRAFAKGLLVAADVEKIATDFAGGMSPHVRVSLVLWLHWPRVIESRSIPKLHKRLEEIFEEKGQKAALPEFEAFKQYAHRIGLSQDLKRRHSDFVSDSEAPLQSH